MHPVRVALLALSLNAAAASAQPGADDAGNRIAPLAAIDRVPPDQAQLRSTLHCTAARDFCLRAWRAVEDGVWTLDLHDRVPAGANVAPARRIDLPSSDNPGRERFSIWPHVIREASGAMLIGAERIGTAGFSGGGASMTHLVLFRLSPDGAEPVEVLTVQTGYSAMIRACFSEEDYRSRGACHDEYELVGIVRLAPGSVSGRPRLAYTVASRSFPRGAREERERRRLRRSDLVWEPDPRCSYRRILSIDAATGRYAPDRPLPAICDTYALP